MTHSITVNVVTWIILSMALLSNKSAAQIPDWNLLPVNTCCDTAPDWSQLTPLAKNILREFIPVEGGTYTLTHRKKEIRFCESSFAMNVIEVTNNAYRQFINWVINYKAREILAKEYPTYYSDTNSKQINMSVEVNWNSPLLDSTLFFPEKERFFHRKKINPAILEIGGISVYPDTTVWLRVEPPFNKVEARGHSYTYFWHPAYDNYPVVGVSRQQANLYIQWLNYIFGNEIGNPDFQLFALPTRYQWAYVGLSSLDEDENGIHKRKKIDFDGKHSNFGAITDQQGVLIKEAADDDALFTSVCAHYPPDSRGFYDLQGNVAEWVYDSRNVDSLIFGQIIGGSWADPPIFLASDTVREQPDNYSDCHTGFRVAMAGIDKKWYDLLLKVHKSKIERWLPFGKKIKNKKR